MTYSETVTFPRERGLFLPLPRLRGRAGEGARAPACPHPSLPPLRGGRGEPLWLRLTLALLLLATLAPLRAQTNAGAPSTPLATERPQASRAPGADPLIGVGGMCLAPGTGSPGGECTSGLASQPTPGPGSGAGNPIDIASGNKYQQDTDLPALPGVLGLELKRHYNSRSRYQGLTGYGWRLSYEAVLHADARSIQIIQADGRRIIFPRDPANPNQCASANPQDGRIEVKDNTYEWHWPSGRVLVFGKWNARAARLETIKERSGEFVSLAYGPKGELLSITDPQQRKLAFHYLAGAKVQLVERIDTPAGTWRYHYEAAHSGGDPNNLTGITDARGVRLATWRYDGEDRAISSEHAGGADKVSLAYHAKRSVLTNSVGAKSAYRHAEIAGALRLTEARGPGCRTCPAPDRRYSYTAGGQLASITRLSTEGTPTLTTHTTYDAQGRLTEVSEQAHVPEVKPRRIARFAYAGDNPHPIRIERPSLVPGQLSVTEIAYNAAWQPLSVTERGYTPAGAAPIERTRSYRYDKKNRLIAIDGPLPGQADVTRFDYDEAGRLIAVQAAENLVTRVRAFDALGRPTKIEDPDGQASALTYTLRGQFATLTRAGLTTRIDYDASGRPVKLTRPDGVFIAAEYDAAGRLIALTDGEGNRREASRDSEGNIVELALRDAEGNTPFEPLAYAFDAYRRLSADGQGRRYAYDQQGRLERLTDSLERRSRFDYDPWGRLTRVLQQAEAASTSSALVKTSLARPRSALIDLVTRFGYAEQDDITREIIAPNGARTQRTLDDFGRVVKTISADAGTASARYNAADQPIELVDANGNTTRFAYDAAGRLTQRLTEGTEAAGTRSLEAAIFRYHGTRLVAVANTEQAEGYAYDAEGRLTAHVTLLSREGQAPLSFTQHYRYDTLGRLIEKRLPDGLALAYDSQSRPKQVLLKHPDGTTEPILQDIHSDGLRGLTRLVFGNGLTTAFARDRQARLAGIATFASPLPAGDKPQVRGLYLQGLGYDQVGRIVRIVRDASIETYAYDALDRLAQARSRAEQQGWRYDGTGNRVAGFHLDDRALAQPIALGGSDAPTERYRYLPASNRLTDILRPGVQPTASAAPWRYDAGGNPIEIGARRYIYDATGRMAEVFEGERPLARYRYNAHGERIAKLVAAGSATPSTQAASGALISAAHASTDSAQATYFLYAGNKIVAEADSQGRISAHYLYLGHTPIAKIETQPIQPNAPPSPAGRRAADEGADSASASHTVGIEGAQPSLWQRLTRRLAQPASSKAPAVQAVRIVFLHADHLGTPQLATDREQRVIWRATYTAFGLATPIEDPDGDGALTQINLRFPGQYFDAETGTHYNYFRDYDPRIGRYLQSDPIGVEGGVNTYGYVAGNPLAFGDPLGLWLEPSDGIPLPWLFGTAVHSRFTTYIRSLGPGWDANTPLGGIFDTSRPDGSLTSLRPDAIYVDRSIPDRPFGYLWELKPVSHQVDPGRAATISKLRVYRSTGNAKNLLNPRANPHWEIGQASTSVPTPLTGGTLDLGTMTWVNNKIYRITVHADPDPLSGLLYYRQEEVGCAIDTQALRQVATNALDQSVEAMVAVGAAAAALAAAAAVASLAF